MPSQAQDKTENAQSGSQNTQQNTTHNQSAYRAQHRPHQARHRNVDLMNLQRKDVNAKLTHAQQLLLQLNPDYRISKPALRQIILKYLVGREQLDPGKLDGVEIARKVRPYMAAEYVQDPKSRRMSVGTMNQQLQGMVYPDKMDELDSNPLMKAQYVDQMVNNNYRPRKDAGGKIHQGIDLDHEVDSDEALEQLFVQANLSLLEFDKKLLAVQERLGARRATAQTSSIKGWERAHEKQQDKYHDASRILDLVRGTLVFDSVTHLVLAKKHISEIFEVYRVKNTIGEHSVTGYQDMKINVKLSTGHIGELQLNLQSMVNSKHHGGHGLYRFIRAYDEKKAYKPEGDDIPKVVSRLQPVLTVLNQEKQRATLNGQQNSSITQEQQEKTISSYNDKITFINNLIRDVQAGVAFDHTNKENGKKLKAISRMVYKSAAQDIDREIGYNQGLQNELRKINQTQM